VFGLLGLGQIVQTYGGSAGYVLMMLHKQHIAMRISITCGLLMIVIGVALMSRFGIIGLAFAYGLGNTIQALAMVYCVRKTFSINTTANYRAVMDFISIHIRKTARHGK
jgi:O-antigen/teichoic acid export membrane protein